MFSLPDIRTMAEECSRQKSGELSVANLAFGVSFARTALVSNKPLTVDNIKIVGMFIEPEINANGFRKLPVFIDGKIAGVHATSIDTALHSLCEAFNDKRIGCDELYQEFESIHPFADGNGRVGFVLYNIFNYGVPGRSLRAAPHYIKS
jgi:hypothetical protein